MKRALFAFALFIAADATTAVREITIHVNALEVNLLGEPADQKVAVYLPPSYDTSTHRYPVLYLLHGIGDPYDVCTEVWKIPQLLDGLIAARSLREMIVVMPNGRTRLLDSFYANRQSAVGGKTISRPR
jgi:enterochelin esterase-like enzyme